jgi:hypothetical protein
MLNSLQPIGIGWGKELIYLYNDAYKSIIGGRHPKALGRPAAKVWPETWSQIGPMLHRALGGEVGTFVESQLPIMERNDYPAETYTWSYTPVPNDDGSAGGIFCAKSDDTARMLAERQLSLEPTTTGARVKLSQCTQFRRSMSIKRCGIVEQPSRPAVRDDLCGRFCAGVLFLGGTCRNRHPVAPPRIGFESGELCCLNQDVQSGAG